MSKYKIGDRVKILDGSNIRDYRCVWYDEGMKEFVGTTGVINYIVEPLGTKYTGYRLKGSPYTWDERGLELVEGADGKNLKPPHPRWKPMNDNAYYYIYSNMAHRIYWGDNYFDRGTYSVGNVFKTEEAAKFAIERLKVLAEMREWAGYTHFGVYIYYCRPSDKIMMNWDGDLDYFYGDIRFNNIDDAENCIKAVGKDRIKKYYFMVPEES